MDGGTDWSVFVVCTDGESELGDTVRDSIDDGAVVEVSDVGDVPASAEAPRRGCVLIEDGAGEEPLEARIDRLREERPDLPVLAVVEDASGGTAALEAGATDFLHRQVAIDHEAVVRGRVRAATSESDSGPGQDLDYYETLLEVLPDTVVITDTDGLILDIHGFDGLSGFAKDELVGEHVSKTMTEEDLATAREVVAELVQEETREKATYESHVVTEEGQKIPVENHTTLLSPDDAGMVPGSMSVVRDVSDRTERQRDLEVKNRAIDEAPIGITIADATDPELSIVYANEGFTELTGYDGAEIIGESWSILRGEETDPSAVADLERGIEEARAVSTELQVHREDDTSIWSQVSLAPVENEDGEVTHFVGFQQDISERKDYEQAIERRFDEFGQVLAQELREPLDRAITDLVAARETGDEDSLENAVTWLRRVDSMLEDISIVHSRSAPERGSPKTPLRSAGSDE